jgi:hypothetical protein
MDFNELCYVETRKALSRLDVRYSRQPSKRQEQRLPMDLADALERKREALVCEEFSPTWIGRAGELP